MEETEEVLGLVVPASGEAAPPLEPREETFDLPTSFVATQRTAILLSVALLTSATLGRDEFNAALLGKAAAQLAAVPSLVPDQSRRQFFHESSVESSFGEHTVDWVSWRTMDSERKTMAVCNRHDLGRLAGSTPSDAVPPFFAGT